MQNKEVKESGGSWFVVRGEYLKIAGVTLWLKTKLPENLAEPGKLMLISNKHQSRKSPISTGANRTTEPSFHDCLSAIGMSNVTVKEKEDFSDIFPETDLFVTDGKIRAGNGMLIYEYSILMQYKIEDPEKKTISLLQINTTSEKGITALQIIQTQRFGPDTPANIARIIACGDQKAIRSHIESTAKFGPSEELLYVKLGEEKWPILTHESIQPIPSLVKELHLIYWKLFGLEVFETDSFLNALSERQKKLRYAYMNQSLKNALTYIVTYYKVNTFGSTMSNLAYDGIPESNAKDNEDINLLLEKFGSELRNLLLNNKVSVRPAIMLRIQEAAEELSQDPDSKRWNVSQANSPLLRTKDCHYVCLTGPNRYQMRFLEHATNLYQGENKLDSTPFEFSPGHSIIGTLVPHNGYVAATKTELLLSPKDEGMFLVLLINEAVKPSKVTPVGCYVEPGKTWLGIVSKLFKKQLSVVVKSEGNHLPNIVVGIDSNGIPWAFAELDMDPDKKPIAEYFDCLPPY